MKRIVILTAAVLMAFSCMTGCGDSQDSGSDNAPAQSAVYSQESGVSDQQHLDAAKETIEQFFDLGSRGEYSKMVKLCSKQLAEYYGYDDLEDGENATDTIVTFSDTDNAVLTDIDGNTIAVRYVEISSEDRENKCYMSVKYDGKEYKIDDIAGFDLKDDEFPGADKYLDLKLEENTRHYLLLVMMSGLSAQPYGGKVKEPAPDGIYKNDDGSDFMKMTASELEALIDSDKYRAGDKTAVDYIKKADSVEYSLTVEGGEITRGFIKVVMGDRTCELDLPDEKILPPVEDIPDESSSAEE